MNKSKILGMIFVSIIILCSSEEDVDSNDERNLKVTENRVAAELFAILDHYKQEDPVGLPGDTVPDPMPVPDLRTPSHYPVTLILKKVLVYGISKFRLKYIKTDISNLNVNAGLHLEELKVTGTYHTTILFSRPGPFTMTFKDVFVSGNATLGVEKDGKIHTQNIKMDITFSDMTMDFKNLGIIFNLFQNMINSSPTFVFDSVKPIILADSYKKIRKQIDQNIEKVIVDREFPNSILPLDMAIVAAKRKVRDICYDPFRLPNTNKTIGLFTIEVTNTWIVGLSSFYRIGNVSISMENNTISARVQLGTQTIDGTTQWEVAFGKVLNRIGYAQFTIQHIKVDTEISQPTDTSKRPKLERLKIDLGNIQLRSEGAGTLDFVFEFIVNIIPNLLRYQIMDAIEGPLKTRIQENLNEIDVEKAIKDNWETFGHIDPDILLDFKF